MDPLDPYQKQAVDEIVAVMKEYRGCLLNGGMRTGKTRVALEVARQLGVKNIIFLTKKDNIDNVHKDIYTMFGQFGINISVITANLMRTRIESYIKIKVDMLVIDESHNFFAQYKTRTSTSKSICGYIKEHDPYVLPMTGTMMPESLSQIYYQTLLIPRSPLIQMYPTFIHFAKDNINIKKKRLTKNLVVDDYSDCNPKEGTREIVNKVIVNMVSPVPPKNKKSLTVVRSECPVANKFLKDLKSKMQIIINDTKKESKTLYFENTSQCIHANSMLSGGTLKYEGRYYFFRSWKLQYIKDQCIKECRTGIFYKYKSERLMLIKNLGRLATESVEEFNKKEKNLVLLQITSKREGIKLKNLTKLVYFSIGYSYLDYKQGAMRGTNYHDDDALDYKVIFLVNKSKLSIDGAVYSCIVGKAEDFKINQKFIGYEGE